jgi:glycosyltransferase involved in cell wall biosynthesis
MYGPRLASETHKRQRQLAPISSYYFHRNYTTNASLNSLMRIGLIITELHPGGAEKCLVHLAIYLKCLGHEVRVWELWPAPPPEKRQLTDELDQHQIPWQSGGAVRPWQFYSATRWLRRELKAFNPDVVQAFLFHGNVAAAIASRGAAWKLFGGARVRQPERLRQILQRWASRRMDELICVSQSVRDHCRDRERIATKKLIVIANGVSLSERTRESNDIELSNFGIPAESRILLFVGRLDSQKGVNDFLPHADRILEDLPGHHLVLVGDGPLKAELAQQRQRLTHASRIHFVGWQPNPLSWMRRCEMLLLPARYEGMPNVVLEAMSVAKPLVVFEVDGIRELLGETQLADCQVIDSGNFNEFCLAIRELSDDHSLRERCGVYNRERVAEHFVLEQQLAKYEQLYSAPR